MMSEEILHHITWTLLSCEAMSVLPGATGSSFNRRSLVLLEGNISCSTHRLPSMICDHATCFFKIFQVTF